MPMGNGYNKKTFENCGRVFQGIRVKADRRENVKKIIIYRPHTLISILYIIFKHTIFLYVNKIYEKIL